MSWAWPRSSRSRLKTAPLLLEYPTGLSSGALTQRSTSASSESAHCASMMTLPGACSPTVSADLAGGFTSDSMSTVIRMKPPSISRAVSSQTVSVSSSMDVAQQAQVDLQPEVGGDPQQRGVERDIHAAHDGGDHVLHLLGVGRGAVAGRRERDDEADDGPEQADPHHMRGDPLHILPAPQEDAGDAEGADADDQPAQRRVAALEGFADEAGHPEADECRGANGLKDDEARDERDLVPGVLFEPVRTDRFCGRQRGESAARHLGKVRNRVLSEAVIHEPPSLLRQCLRLRVGDRHGTSSFAARPISSSALAWASIPDQPRARRRGSRRRRQVCGSWTTRSIFLFCQPPPLATTQLSPCGLVIRIVQIRSVSLFNTSSSWPSLVSATEDGCWCRLTASLASTSFLGPQYMGAATAIP